MTFHKWPNAECLNAESPNAVILSVLMLSNIMLGVLMLNNIMLSVFELSVVAPLTLNRHKDKVPITIFSKT